MKKIESKFTMSKINFDARKFESIQNSEAGEVSAETIFQYHHKEDLVWAEYEGGEIVFGNLIAKVSESGELEMRYQHLNKQGALMTGVCHSTPEILADGRLRLHEKWQWTSGDLTKGESVVEEIKTPQQADRVLIHLKLF